MTALAYLLVIVAANLGLAALGPSWMPLIGFVAIGLDLTLRDRLHEEWRHRWLWPKMLAVIAAGGALSALVAPGSRRIAAASAVSFVLSGAVDALVYGAITRRSTARVVSNLCGAAVDSLAFPALAFWAWMPALVVAQFGAKAGGGVLWATLFNLKERKSC